MWRRLVASATAAYQTFTTWKKEALATHDAVANWDEYALRQFRYIDSWHYFDNSVFTNLQRYATQKINDQRLYTYIKPIYNPVNRLVNAYVAKVYGGVLDLETMKHGAIPITTDNDDLRDALRQLWLWSNMSTQKSLYTRYGATLGDVAIKVVDDRRRGKVRLDFMHPGLFEEVDFDEVGNVKRAVIAYKYIEQESKDKSKTYSYKEIITKDRFQTFRDNEPYAYYENANGEAVAEWDNEYGFVPVVISKHADIGKQWGANSFFSAWNKIDSLNDLASLLNNQVRKIVMPIYAADFPKGSDLTATENKDSITIIHIPDGKTMQPLVAPIDIANTSQLIQEQLREIERDLPELTLHRLRESGNLTAPGVRAGYDDAIQKFVEARGMYDGGLINAAKMAVSIGGLANYRNFESFDLNSFERGDIEFHVSDRAVIDDKLSKHEKVTFLMQALELSSPVQRRIALEEIGVATDSIDDLEKEQTVRENQTLATVAEAIRQGLNTNEQPNQAQPSEDNRQLALAEQAV